MKAQFRELLLSLNIPRQIEFVTSQCFVKNRVEVFCNIVIEDYEPIF